MSDLDPNREWMPRFEELMTSKHLRQQAERAYEVHRIIRGTKDSLPWDDFHREVARLVALVEVTGVKSTANVGGITVERGPMEGYSIMLHAADVYVMHMHSLSDDPKKLWDRAMELWKREKKENP